MHSRRDLRLPPAYCQKHCPMTIGCRKRKSRPKTEHDINSVQNLPAPSNGVLVPPFLCIIAKEAFFPSKDLSIPQFVSMVVLFSLLHAQSSFASKRNSGQCTTISTEPVMLPDVAVFFSQTRVLYGNILDGSRGTVSKMDDGRRSISIVVLTGRRSVFCLVKQEQNDLNRCSSYCQSRAG
jgi:hypothetical protein